MVKLVVISEEMKDLTFELTEEKITIGRVPGNQIRLDHSAVSSHHAELTKKGDDYLLRDLNSTNGTRVNGQRVVETRLFNGDTIAIAHVQLQYISTSRTAPQPLPSPNKRTVDLSASRIDHALSKKPQTFSSASPFSKQSQGQFKRFFQIALYVLALVAVALLGVAIYTIFQS
jgi:pSer/pThr/pTyr-binding forkhead associated (FHA) protein